MLPFHAGTLFAMLKEGIKWRYKRLKKKQKTTQPQNKKQTCCLQPKLKICVRADKHAAEKRVLL